MADRSKGVDAALAAMGLDEGVAGTGAGNQESPRTSSVNATSPQPSRQTPTRSETADSFLDGPTATTRVSALHPTRHALPGASSSSSSSSSRPGGGGAGRRQDSKSSTTSSRAPLPDPAALTPLRAHYLKKTLVGLEVERELGALSDPGLGGSALGLLGPPFSTNPPVIPLVGASSATVGSSSPSSSSSGAATPPGSAGGAAGGGGGSSFMSLQDRVLRRQQAEAAAALSDENARDLPLLRFMFRRFLLPFPFLAAAPPTFWSHKVQPFLACFLAISQNRINPSTASVSAGPSGLFNGGENDTPAEPDFSLWTPEEIYEYKQRKKIWDKAQKVLGMLFGAGVKVVGGEEVVRIGQRELRRLEKEGEERRRKWIEREKGKLGFEVNVVCTRTVVEKLRMRSKTHDEFIICTKRPGTADVLVSRRYGDFKRLADELRAQFPDTPLPLPPPKDRTSTATAASQAAAAQSAQAAYGGYSAYNPMRMLYGSSSSSAASSSTSSSPAVNPADPVNDASNLSTPLAREKNRLTLRAYLNAILAIPAVINSPVLRSFLLSNPTTLTPEEAADARRRAEADAVREEGRKRFQKEAEKRVEALREGLSEFKGDIIGKEGGLKAVFEVVRRVENVRDLPRAEASVLEWGRISLAGTIFQMFVASDNASETFMQLKRLHGMLPYFVLKGILRVSNPMAMIRGVLDLFLARPFGGQSLLQRMFSSSLTEDVRLLQEDINTMYERIDDPALCRKIELYVHAPYEVQEIYRSDAASEKLDLIAVILRSPEMPALNRMQIQRVIKANRAYKQYKQYQSKLEDSDDDEGPQNEDAWLFEDLHLLLKLMVRKREKEQLVGLIFEGLTAELLKDIITIFYTPLATVYKAASIADSLGDLQNFINDLIKTVEAVEELAQEDPSATVQTFIDLVQRHEQSFYTFVHRVHKKGEGLFDSIMDWVEVFLTFARDGLAQDVDLEFLLPHTGDERVAIMKEIDLVAQYHYKLKLAYEEKVRRRFQKEGATDEESALIDSVIAGLNLQNATVRDDAGELGADDESEDDEEDEFDLQEATEAAFSADKDRSTAAWKSKGSETNSIASTESPRPEQEAHESKGRSSMERVRHSLDFGRHHKQQPEPQQQQQQQQARPTEPERVAMAPKYKKINRRGKKRDIMDIGEPPVLKYIPQLTPVFVEILRPMLQTRAPGAPPPQR